LHSPINIEEQLLAELAKGERKATEQIYKQHYKMITAWIQQNGGSEADASDIYQEAAIAECGLQAELQDRHLSICCEQAYVV
jgi:replication-associated recombination protein RarA